MCQDFVYMGAAMNRARIITGILIVAIGIGSTLLVKLGPKGSVAEVLRPVKTLVIEPGVLLTGRKYPGKVRASEKVDLAFQVGGPLIELPVKRGQRVEKGELLGRIDPRDYENDLAAKTAEEERTRTYYERIAEAVKTGAVSKTDLSNAKADYEKAVAERRIADKALEDTYLLARFTGVVADRYVENYQNVKPKEYIVSLQDITSVEVEVNVPEQRIGTESREDEEEKYRFVVKFDYLPGRQFDVEIKEFAMEADPRTQTFLATFVMPSPEDLIILPGMTGTVYEYLKETEAVDADTFLVPVEAVVVDGLGNYYMWVVGPWQDDSWRVHRQDIEVGEMIGGDIIVTGGVKAGMRIAAGGVHLLQDGQEVRRLEDAAVREESK